MQLMRREQPGPRTAPRGPHIEQRAWRWLRLRYALLRVKLRDLTLDVGITAVTVVALSLPWFWLAVWLSGYALAVRCALTGVSLLLAGGLLFMWGWWLDRRARLEELWRERYGTNDE